MKITLLVISKTDEPYLQQGIDIYVKRLRHYAPFELEVIPAVKASTPEELKEREAQLILRRIEKADCVVLLDEHGRQPSSVGFAEYLQKKMNQGIKQLTFVVGGAFGFASSVYQAAHDKLSLSPMTFNHQMVRLIFVEQLYRAFTILRHEPYHNE